LGDFVNRISRTGRRLRFGLARNHPFIDGNKRVAFAALIVFLGLNDVDFDVAPEQATAMVLALAAGEVSEESLWIRDNWPARNL
jgi:death-on-curing protein